MGSDQGDLYISLGLASTLGREKRFAIREFTLRTTLYVHSQQQ